MIASATGKGLGPLFAFAGGGTGGHLYPAIAVATAIRRRMPEARFVFFGTQRTIDHEILSQVDAEVVGQPLTAMSARPWRWPGLISGWRDSFRSCAERFEADRPCVVVVTGGFASVPAARVAARMRIPLAILNPDTVPGRANRLLGRGATVVFAQFESTRERFGPRTEVRVTGCPVRPAFLAARREDGIAAFQLDPRKRTLLVTGASLGARTINEAMVSNLGLLASQTQWQILHLTGQTDYEAVATAYERFPGVGKAMAYTERMAEALGAADLVVARAGASTLAELTAVGRASILVPYPYHRDQHQYGNALCLAECGAARIVRDAAERTENARNLRTALLDLLPNHALRERMAEAARRLGRVDAGEVIAAGILEISGNSAEPADGARCESVEALCATTR